MDPVLYLEIDKKERQITFYTLSESGYLHDTALNVIETVRWAANDLRGSYMDADSVLHLNVTPRKAYKWIVSHVDRSLITFSYDTACDVYASRLRRSPVEKPKRTYKKG